MYSRSSFLFFILAWFNAAHSADSTRSAPSKSAPSTKSAQKSQTQNVDLPSTKPTPTAASSDLPVVPKELRAPRFGQGLGIGSIRIAGAGNTLLSSLGASASNILTAGIEGYGEYRFNSYIFAGLSVQQVLYNFSFPSGILNYDSWLGGLYLGYQLIPSRRYELPIQAEFNTLLAGSMETRIGTTVAALSPRTALGGSILIRMKYFLIYDRIGLEVYSGYRFLKPTVGTFSFSGIALGLLISSRF